MTPVEDDNSGDFLNQISTALLDSLPIGIYACDSEGLLLYFNKKASQIWGREPELKNLNNRFCGALRMFETNGTPITYKNCPMVLALSYDKSVENLELTVEQPDGNKVDILVKIQQMYEESGALTGAICVFEDITEKCRLEDRLIRSEKVIEVGKNASKIGHQLNNILTAILGSIEFGLQDLEKDHIAYAHFEQIKLVANEAVKETRKLTISQ